MDPEKIGKFIKDLRKGNNMTQAEFAQKYNVTYQAVSNWEKGKNIPDISLLKEISKDYSVSIDDLLDGEKNSTIKKNNRITIIGISLLAIVIVIATIVIIINNKNSYEFKTLSTTCSKFTISGTVAYDKNKTSIFINKINYCGGNDENQYKKIECSLFEKKDDSYIKISSYVHDKNPITLEAFLKEVEFSIDDYARSCKKISDDNLFLRINATDKKDNTITHDIPLTLNKPCSD
jgi:transcriptional regulator with XRE-family HTH domain